MSKPWEMLCHTLNKRPIIPKLYMEQLNYTLLVNILYVTSMGRLLHIPPSLTRLVPLSCLPVQWTSMGHLLHIPPSLTRLVPMSVYETPNNQKMCLDDDSKALCKFLLTIDFTGELRNTRESKKLELSKKFVC